MPTAFGKRLRTQRERAGLSQSGLAGEGISASYISLLEAGKRQPSPQIVEQLAARLGCTAVELTGAAPSERDQRIDLELAYARLAIEHGESADARRRLEALDAEGHALPVRVRDEVHLLLATAYEKQGDHRRAIGVVHPLFERSAGSPSVPTQLLVTSLGIQLTRLYMITGDLGQAIAVGEKALRSAREQDLSATTEHYRLAATVMGAHIMRGDFLTASQLAESYYEQAVRDDERAGQAALLWNAALAQEQQGDLARSLGMAERAVALLSELENVRDYARIRVTFANLLLWLDPPQVRRAADLLERCESDLLDIGGPNDMAAWYCLTAQVLLHDGNAVEAEVRARQAVDQAARGIPASEQAMALVTLSDALDAQGRPSTDLLTAALDCFSRERPSRWDAKFIREIGARLAPVDPPAAVRAYELALDAAGVPDRSRPLRDQVRALKDRSDSDVRQSV